MWRILRLVPKRHPFSSRFWRTSFMPKLPFRYKTSSEWLVIACIVLEPLKTYQTYPIGEKSQKLHFKPSFHNYFCLIFYLTLNEYVQLHLVMELTFKFPGARYEYSQASAEGGFPSVGDWRANSIR